MAIEIVDFPIKNGDFHCYVSLPEGNPHDNSTFLQLQHVPTIPLKGPATLTPPVPDPRSARRERRNLCALFWAILAQAAGKSSRNQLGWLENPPLIFIYLFIYIYILKIKIYYTLYIILSIYNTVYMVDHPT